MNPNELLLSVYPWVRLLAGRCAVRCGVDADDLTQEAVMLLLARAEKYDPARGRPTTWASAALIRMLPRLAARLAGRPGARELTARVPDRRAADPADAAADAENRRLAAERVRRALPRLGPRQRKVVTARFGLGAAPPAKGWGECDPAASRHANHEAGKHGLANLAALLVADQAGSRPAE